MVLAFVGILFALVGLILCVIAAASSDWSRRFWILSTAGIVCLVIGIVLILLYGDELQQMFPN